MVLGRLLRERRTTEDELQGLGEDKILAGDVSIPRK